MNNLASLPGAIASIAPVTPLHAVPPPPPIAPYEINRKLLGLAFVVEVAVIGAVASFGYLLANRYAGTPGPGNELIFGFTETWWAAIIPSFLFGAAECLRVPLAVAAAKRVSLAARIAMMIVIALMVGVTAKSIAQSTEQLFHGRLVEVFTAQNALNTETERLASVEASGAHPAAELASIDAQIADVQKEIGGYSGNLNTIGAPPKSVTTYRRDAKGRRYPVTTTPPYQGRAVIERMADAEKRLVDLRNLRGGASTKAAAAGTTIADQKLAIAKSEEVLGAALMHSQMHSFAGMIFSKSPASVTMDEVFCVMKWFVLWASIAVSIIGTAAAYFSITRNPAAQPARIPSPKEKLEIIPSVRESFRDIGIKLEKVA